MFEGLNYWAILVSGAVFFVLGGIWYAVVFSKSWQAALNFSPEEAAEQEKGCPVALGVHLLCGLVASFVMAALFSRMEFVFIQEGLHGGLLLWVGFSLTANLINMKFERRPKAVFFINSGFYLVAYLAMGVIIASWR